MAGAGRINFAVLNEFKRLRGARPIGGSFLDEVCKSGAAGLEVGRGDIRQRRKLQGLV